MNILTLKDLSVEEIYQILDLAKEFENGKEVDYKGKKIIGG